MRSAAKRNLRRTLADKIVGVQFVDLEGQQLRNYERLEQSCSVMPKAISVWPCVAPNAYPVVAPCVEAGMHRRCRIGEIRQQWDWLEERLRKCTLNGVPTQDCEKALVFTQYPQLVCKDWKLQIASG